MDSARYLWLTQNTNQFLEREFIPILIKYVVQVKILWLNIVRIFFFHTSYNPNTHTSISQADLVVRIEGIFHAVPK